MTLIGFVEVPFQVSITMHAAIHADHYVGLYANDARLSVDSSTANMVFTPANWNVGQLVTVTPHGAGDLELLAHISADYFVNGAGVRRFANGLIDLSVTVLPLDVWVGTVPQWYDGGLGGVTISHNNVAVGHYLVLSMPSWTGIGLDVPFLVASHATIVMIQPDGTRGVLGTFAPGGSVSHTTTMLGVYRFIVIMDACFIQSYNVGTGHTIQASVFRWQVFVNSSGMTSLVGPVDSSAIRSQGVAVVADNTGLSHLDSPRPADGSFSFNLPTAYAESNVLGGLTYVGGGGTTTSNCTGTVVGGAGTIALSGARINFPSAVSLGRAGIEVHFDTTDTGIRVSSGYNCY